MRAVAGVAPTTASVHEIDACAARARQQLAGTALVSRPPQRRAGAAQRAIVAEAATKQVTRRPVPLELEKGELPMNTFNNKKPFKATIKSVERIVGPKATGETCHIILETKGEIPFWEGQSYGIVPPVGSLWPGLPTSSAAGAGCRAGLPRERTRPASRATLPARPAALASVGGRMFWGWAEWQALSAEQSACRQKCASPPVMCVCGGQMAQDLGHW
jgi:hypothetical protein